MSPMALSLPLGSAYGFHVVELNLIGSLITFSARPEFGLSHSPSCYRDLTATQRYSLDIKMCVFGVW